MSGYVTFYTMTFSWCTSFFTSFFFHNIHWNTQLLRNISVIFTNILFMLIDFFICSHYVCIPSFENKLLFIRYYSDICLPLVMLSLFTLSTITQIYAFLWPCCRYSRCLLLLRYKTSSDHVVVIHVVYYYSDIWRHLTMLSLFTLSKYALTPSLYVTLPRILPSVSHNHSLTVKDSHNANLFLFLMKCFPTLITISRSKFLWNVFE